MLLQQSFEVIVVSDNGTNAAKKEKIKKLSTSQQNHASRNGVLPLNHKLLFAASFCYFAAMTATNEALAYVSYPSATLAKSCKLIPTMLMGYFVERHVYHTREWVGAALITVGIVIFNISRLSIHDSDDDAELLQRDSPYGLFLLAFSLAVDGCTNSCQSQLKIQGDYINYRPPSALETMFWTNLYAIFFFLPTSLFSGHWSNGINAIHQVEDAAAMMMQLNALAMAGQICIFFTITFYSPLMCTTITTTRKFFTIILSVLRFGHVFSAVQWSAVVMVFGGLFMEISCKQSSSCASSSAHSAAKAIPQAKACDEKVKQT